MNDKVLKAHTYKSASARLDEHLNKPMAEKNTDHWFHMMMALLVDEASKGKKLYVPAFSFPPSKSNMVTDMGGKPLYRPPEQEILSYTVNGTKVYAVYTDPTAAVYASELCKQASLNGKMYPAKARLQERGLLPGMLGWEITFMADRAAVKLDAVLEKADGNCLAVNPGLSSQMILPPAVTHTAFMLLLEHQGARLANTDYNEWISLVNGCLVSDEAKDPGIREFSMPETKMSIDFKPRNAGKGKVIYEIIPQR